jgi:hypothetical protein
MNKAPLIAASAIAIFALSGGSASAAAGGQDQVTGSAKIDAGIHFEISAHSGPLGEDPRGNGRSQVDLPEAQGDTQGRVTCLNVMGNQATVELQITRSTQNPAFVGQYSYLFFQDNGPPAGGQAVDLVGSTQPMPMPAPMSCHMPVGDLFPFDKGNIVIKDAP